MTSNARTTDAWTIKMGSILPACSIPDLGPEHPLQLPLRAVFTTNFEIDNELLTKLRRKARNYKEFARLDTIEQHQHLSAAPKDVLVMDFTVMCTPEAAQRTAEQFRLRVQEIIETDVTASQLALSFSGR